MADDIRIEDTAGESDALPSELREIESRFLQDSLVWGADLDGVARLTQLVRSLPARTTDTAVVLKTGDGEREASDMDDAETELRDHQFSVTQSPRQPHASSPWIAGVTALVVVALLAVVFSTLSPGHTTRTGTSPTATTGVTATVVEPTATLTPLRTPAPTATATSAPAPVLGPFTAILRIQQNGNNISASFQSKSCTSQVQFGFEVDVHYSYAPAGYVAFHWQHYDGSSPGEPPNTVINQAPSSVDVQQIPTGSPQGDLYAYTEEWTVQPPDFSGSTPRWGSQFIITAINGKTLATPIASNILHVPTGC